MKSLVSIRITITERSGFNSFPIYELMQRWPRIQMIRIGGICNLWLRGRERPNTPDLLALSAFNCCPKLHEIDFTRGYVSSDDLRSFRFMCSGVMRLGISVSMSDDTALIGCLQAWSPTLQCVRLRMGGPYSPRIRLSKALPTLWRLEELQIHEFEVDLGAICDLPQLKRLCYRSIFADEVLRCLPDYLKTSSRFPALEVFSIYAGNRANDVGELGDLCVRRNIKLHMWDGYTPLSGFML